MVSRRLVLFKKIKEMLSECAPSHEVVEKTHFYWVTWKDRIYRTLPKGSHKDRGKRSGQAEIEIGHVKKMIRHLQIDFECARKVIPRL